MYALPSTLLEERTMSAPHVPHPSHWTWIGWVAVLMLADCAVVVALMLRVAGL